MPFLPTNPHLSATRNQGRQKLARFSPNEFMGLLTDVLIDGKRRQNMAALRPLGMIHSFCLPFYFYTTNLLYSLRWSKYYTEFVKFEIASTTT